jgi:hypothetical protein
MTLHEIQVSLQALSSLAIAGGLVYTAIQFRKSRQAAHFANFSKLVEMQMHLREMRVSDPSLAEVYRHDVEHARSSPDAQRAVREYFFNLMQLSVFEIVWFGYQSGQVPHDYFKSWEDRMREIAAERSFRVMWNTPSMKIMHDEFQVYMSELVRTTPAKD